MTDIPKQITVSPSASAGLDDSARLSSLASYHIMDSEPEAAFDDVACLAATLCDTPAAFVTFVDANHQFFKASVGAGDVREAVMESGFCPFTVALGDVLIIPDTLADPLYASNPVVVGDAGVRFYACVPVRDPDGRVLGTVCVVDQKPHTISDANIDGLRALGRQVENLLALRRASHDAQATARRAEAVLSATSDAIITLDRDFRVVYANAEAARINKKPVEAFLGKLHWDEWPASVGTQFETEFRRAMTERVAVRFLEHYYVPNQYDDWIRVSAYPAADEDGGGIHVVYRDVTERHQQDRRMHFLADLAERARGLTDPEAVIADAVRSVGTFLDVSRCTFADIDLEADTVTIHADYCAEGIASIAGVVPLTAFGPYVYAELSAGRAVVVDDVQADPLHFPPDALATYEGGAIRAFIVVPVVHSSRLVSVLSIHSATPRHWKLEKLDLLRTVVERTWLTVQVTREHKETLRLAHERARLVAHLQEAGARQRRFLREMLAGFTEGRLRLCFDGEDLPSVLPSLGEPIALSAQNLRVLRKEVEAAGTLLQMPDERVAEYLTAVHEAAMNAVRHGGSATSTARICGDRETGLMQIWVEDHGPGIAEDMIHRAVEQGFTTGGFGQGFFLIRSCADRVYLLTGKDGTTVVLEQERDAPLPAWLK